MSTRETLFERACKHIPGGVNSPARSFKSVGGTPLFIERAEGPCVYDSDGNRYVDYVGSFGPAIVGHAHPQVVEAVQRAAANGLSFGAPTAREVEMAERLCELVPSMDMVRLVNSGTEATMSAIRLARGFTGRDKIIKFEGCYHGHVDSLLVKAGSGALTHGSPSSPGVPASFVEHTITLPYNDISEAFSVFTGHGDDIAAVIVEPVAGNMNCVPPAMGFLDGLRQLCDDHGALLIFDEVMTGFRVAPGGAQERYGIRPDLTTLGKVIGGGLPVGAYGGRRDVMEEVAPSGPMYQAGTLSGNPLAVAAGLATLSHLARHPEVHEHLEALGRRLDDRMSGLVEAYPDRLSWSRVGAMGSLAFVPGPVHGWAEISRSDTELFGKVFRDVLEEGVMLPPSCYEALFWSAAHEEADIDRLADAMASALQRHADA